MALTPARMKHVDMLVLADDVRRVTTALGRLGVLHLVEVRPEEATMPVARRNTGEALLQCDTLLRRLDALIVGLGRRELPPPGEETHESLALVERKIAVLEQRVASLAGDKTQLESEAERIQDELARLAALGKVTVPISRLTESPYLHFAFGEIKANDLKRLETMARPGMLLIPVPGRPGFERLIAITSRKGRFALETLLREHNFVWIPLTDVPQGAPAEVLDGLYRRVDDIRSRLTQISRQLHALSDEHAVEISRLRSRLLLEQALIRAEMNFGETRSTCVISGWLPEDSMRLVSERLLHETGGRIILQSRDPEEVGAAATDIPVQMRHGRFIKPFEMLVSGFGFPKYNEVEPTLMVAISFLIMYGLMFGDVGQGAVLALVGVGLHLKGKVPTLRDLGFVLAAAGLAGALGGFLYGSVFGMELLKPLWLKPIDAEHPDDILKLLGFPIVIGIAIISLGVVFNIVNRVRSREYVHAVLDRFGIIGIIFYWGALALGLRYLLLGKSFGVAHLVILILLPLLILFFREPIIHLLTRRKQTEGSPLETAIQGGVEVMETISSYLSNTFSFARVGAFALAHAGLCFAIFAMVEVVRGLPAGKGLGVVVIVLGNVLVLCLEGLIVFVQCLRLEYYEFFGKFFSGSGTRYSPFRIG